MLKYVKLPIVPISNTKNMAWQLYELLISIFPEQFIYTEIEKAEKKSAKLALLTFFDLHMICLFTQMLKENCNPANS